MICEVTFSYPDFLSEVVVADPQDPHDGVGLGPLQSRHQLLHLLDVDLDAFLRARQGRKKTPLF